MMSFGLGLKVKNGEKWSNWNIYLKINLKWPAFGLGMIKVKTERGGAVFLAWVIYVDGSKTTRGIEMGGKCSVLNNVSFLLWISTNIQPLSIARLIQWHTK